MLTGLLFRLKEGSMTRACQHCGEPIPRYSPTGVLLSKCHYERRLFCCPKCSHKSQEVRVEVKCCEACGARLEQRENEPNTKFSNRRTCNRLCAGRLPRNAAQRKPRADLPVDKQTLLERIEALHGPELARVWREYLTRRAA